MVALDAFQFALGEDPDAYLFGTGTDLPVSEYTPGDPDLTAGDQANVGRDGTTFGKDTKSGVLHTFEMQTDCLDAATAKAVYREFSALWDAPGIRSIPGAVIPLRMCLPGSEPVRVYGRPRKCSAANLKLIESGAIPLVADFQAADHLYYSDIQHSLPLSLLPAIGDGGLTFPLSFPLSFAPNSAPRADRVTNAGDRPTWPVITFSGPIINPSIAFTGTNVAITLQTVLASDQTVTIDPRPWAMTITRQDGASLAGTRRGSLLADLKLPTGDTIVAFHGIDLTGTSGCVLTWRDGQSTP